MNKPKLIPSPRYILGSYESGAPLQQPATSYRRGYYETGRDPNFNTEVLATTPWESVAIVSRKPCWLTLIHVVFPVTFPPGQQEDAYALLYDTTDTSLIVAGAIARFTFGPVIAGSGGTIIYEAEAEEVPCIPQCEGVKARGIPFNFGLIVAASTTPRILTTLDEMAVTARIQI